MLLTACPQSQVSTGDLGHGYKSVPASSWCFPVHGLVLDDVFGGMANSIRFAADPQSQVFNGARWARFRVSSHCFLRFRGIFTRFHGLFSDDVLGHDLFPCIHSMSQSQVFMADWGARLHISSSLFLRFCNIFMGFHWSK